MKKTYLFSILTAFFISLTAYAQQAAMPTIIVFPSDEWMNEHGYMKTIDNDGETEYIPRYNDAFVQTRDMGAAIQALQKVFEERKFEHEDLQSLLKDMKRERAEELANAADGDATEKGAMDDLMQQARPDIRVDLDYGVTAVGPRKNISYKIKAVDAYTSEQCASIEGTIEMTMDPIDLAIRKAVAGNCDDFCQQIIDYFLDLRDNGRKINVIFRAAKGAGINFIKDEIGDEGDTYDEFLYDWVKKHAVKSACKKGRKTANMVEFKSVRIPFFNEEDEPIEAEDWAKKVRKAFKDETGIKVSKGQGNTLGRVNFIVGE
ncbi:MAG: hypothetical protein J6P55_08730 [Bacteroidaceae bacterium]|nr:hypothetical protein [Bacteroidaceae bacterium]MBR1902458.1 hypothetical protein [Bacteroidaceae bacterium]